MAQKYNTSSAAVRGVPADDGLAINLDVPDVEVRASLNRIARESLRPVTLVGGVLYLLLGVIFAAVAGGDEGVRQAVVAIAAAGVFLGSYVALGRWRLPPAWVHPVGTALVMVSLAHAVIWHITYSPRLPHSFGLFIVGIGILYLDTRWSLIASAIVIGAWTLVDEFYYPSIPSSEFLGHVAASVIVGLIAHLARTQSLTRVERLSLREERYVHALRQATRRIKRSEERFQRLADATFEGIVLHDGKMILDANRATCAMFGLELHEIVGRKVLDFIAPESRTTAEEHIRLRSEQPYEALGLRKDGSTFPIEIRGRMLDDDGRMIRVVAIRDITGRKHAEAEREQLIAELDAFAHTVAHDLKNPLGLMMAYTDLLRDDLESGSIEQLRSYVHGLADGAHKMSRIIDELLVLAQTRQAAGC